MKKLFSVLAVLFVMGTTSVFALGIGAQGGYTIGGGAGGALTFKVDNVPCVFAVDLGSINPLQIGATADWWIANPKIEKTWGYYYGVGLAASVGIGENWADLGIGARALVGTNIFLLDSFLEFYLQIAWQPTFWIHLNGDSGYDPFKPACFPVNLGFRFWF